MKPIFILFLVCAFHSINIFGFDYGGFSLDDTILQNKVDREIGGVRSFVFRVGFFSVF